MDKVNAKDIKFLQIASKDVNKFRDVISKMPQKEAIEIINNLQDIGVEIPKDIKETFSKKRKQWYQKWWVQIILWLLVIAIIRMIFIGITNYSG